MKPVGQLYGSPTALTAKPNTSRQKQISTAKPKLFCFCCEVFGFAVRFLVWFCLEVFGFAVTLVGHHRVSKMALKKWNTNLCWNIPSGKTRLPFQMFHCSGCSRNFKLERRTKYWSCSIYFPTGFSGIFL